MALAYREGLGLSAKFFGSILLRDVENYVNHDFYTVIKNDVSQYIEDVDIPTAVLTKVRPFIRIKSYDEAAIKSFGGIPIRSQYGTYAYNLSGFYHFPEFISIDQQVCKPAHLWVTPSSFPELLDLEDPSGVDLTFSIFASQESFGSNEAIIANTIVFNFYQTVIADIQIFYSAVALGRSIGEGQIGVQYVNI